VPTPQYQLLGTVESRANMYRERLLLTQQRLLRSELFALKGMGNSTLTTKHKGTNQMVHEVSFAMQLKSLLCVRTLVLSRALPVQRFC
jgi:hypothetical protein